MMTQASAGAPDDSILQLPAVLDLQAAAPLAAELLGRRGAALTLDGSAVQRLGGQCLQVLLAAQASWMEDAQPLSIANASPEFCAAAALFGAGAVLGFQLKEPSL